MTLLFSDVTISSEYCENDACYNFSVISFDRCVECLPSKKELEQNYIDWNHDALLKSNVPYYPSETKLTSNICQSRMQQKNCDYYYSTNCIVTAQMIRIKYAMKPLREVQFRKKNKNMNDFWIMLKQKNACQIEFWYEEIFHVITIIGSFILDSFFGIYPLKIRHIDDEWKTNFAKMHLRQILADHSISYAKYNCKFYFA